VDSTHVEKTTLQDYKKQIFLFVRHNMQLAKHLCCNPGQPFKPADLDGPDNHDASTTNLNQAAPLQGKVPSEGKAAAHAHEQ